MGISAMAKGAQPLARLSELKFQLDNVCCMFGQIN